MAKDFNVYEWRRNMIQENVGADDLESIKKLPFNQAIKAYYGGSEPTKKEVEIFADLYFGNPASLNESDSVVKRIKDVTWEDVAGLSVPTAAAGVRKVMDDRDTFSDEWRQSTLDTWKRDLAKHFPNAMEMEITIDRSAEPYFNKVKITDPEYLAKMSARNKAVQADYDKSEFKGD